MVVGVATNCRNAACTVVALSLDGGEKSGSDRVPCTDVCPVPCCWKHHHEISCRLHTCRTLLRSQIKISTTARIEKSSSQRTFPPISTAHPSPQLPSILLHCPRPPGGGPSSNMPPPTAFLPAPILRFRHPALPPPSRRPTPRRRTTPTSSAPTSPDRTFAASSSADTSLSSALASATSSALAALGPSARQNVSVAVVFVSARYAVATRGPRGRESLADVAPCLRNILPGLQAVFGCTSDGVAGGGTEVENAPGVSVSLLHVPGIDVKTFHVMPDDVPSLDASQAQWRRIFGTAGDDAPAFMLLSDAGFAESGGLKRCMAGLDFAYPGASVFGGVASAGAAFPKGHLICTLPRDVLGSAVSPSLRDSGVVGIALGNCDVDCIVSQGCRALGPTFEVRKIGGRGEVVEMEQVGRPGSVLSATGCLKAVIDFSTPTEAALLDPACGALHVGFAPSEFDEKVGDEDFVVRKVVRVGDEGGISLGGPVRVGQRLRFVVAEEVAARNALHRALQSFKKAELAKTLVGYSNPPMGALMFLDAGRGQALFRESGYETQELAEVTPTMPVGGMFSSGQIGATRKGEAPTLHNAASVIAVIRNRSAVSPADPPLSPTDMDK